MIECKLVQHLRRTVWKLLTKLNIELPNDPAIPLLGMFIFPVYLLLVLLSHSPSAPEASTTPFSLTLSSSLSRFLLSWLRSMAFLQSSYSLYSPTVLEGLANLHLCPQTSCPPPPSPLSAFVSEKIAAIRSLPSLSTSALPLL